LDFPFLKLDEVAPISVPFEQISYLERKFVQLIEEYQSAHLDRFDFIESYLNLILLSIKRFTRDLKPAKETSEDHRNSDIQTIARYQSMIESRLNQHEVQSTHFSTSYYASELAMHPNHLNALSKRITGKTAKQLIQEKVLQVAKSLLIQTNLSIREIAFQLGYNETAHFHNFFKKSTSLTPNQFRATAQV